MSNKDKENTEEKILEAAKKVFVSKGSDGARMQEIADQAGINKSLLHYYYRSKEKLFKAVFEFAFKKIAPNLLSSFEGEKNIFAKIEVFIDNYINLIDKNPFIPMFVFNEINKKNTGFISRVIKKSAINIKSFEETISEEVKNGTIKPISAKHLLVNIIALCIFPYIGRPIVQVVVYEDNKDAYEKFLKQRKKEITDLIHNYIKP